MYLNHTRFDADLDRIISLSDSPASPVVPPETMLTAIAVGVAASCTIDDARAIVLALEDGDFLTQAGYTSEAWVSELHHEMKMLLKP